MPSDTIISLQTWLPWNKTAAVPYTSSPLRLLINDIAAFFMESWSLPFIVVPLWPYGSGELDELYPSVANIYCITVHVLLAIAQVAFIVSIPIAMLSPLPILVVVGYIVGFCVVNWYLCRVQLNGYEPILHSKFNLDGLEFHLDEQWIFLNGVAVGSHWLQSNIDRLSRSFLRPVMGIHNPTAGIVFDVLECLIQRDFNYATNDIRNAYREVKKAISNPKNKKVVFILHSQGGLEGGLVVDWLLADVPIGLLQKLEVYTFGCAANHFNNPRRADPRSNGGIASSDYNVIRHIEHYANSKDFVSRWGVLKFASAGSTDSSNGMVNNYKGRVFVRDGEGHQLNQHYLDSMFPLDEKLRRGLSEHNPFMESTAVVVEDEVESENGTSVPLLDKHDDPHNNHGATIGSKRSVLHLNSIMSEDNPEGSSLRKVGDLSRLWAYRNGMSPAN